MQLYCDNKSTTDIAHNLVEHDITKHTKFDIHFIKDNLDRDMMVITRVLMQLRLA